MIANANKKLYVRPDFTMMHFNLSDSVATCPTDVTYNKVTVTCIISGSHEVFYTGCSSNYSDMTTVTIYEDMTFSSENAAINYLSGSGSSQGGGQGGGQGGWGSSYTLTAGTYLVWYENGNYHAGLVSPSITSTVNSSL